MIEKLSRECEKLKDNMVRHRRFIHENAEVGFDTKKTSEYIYKTLCSLGVECQSFDEGFVTAEIVGKGKGKTVLLRADIDALPMLEETSLDFACKENRFHACGHDMHASMLLGCAQVLMGMRNDFCGTARLLFQPAEEILQGAKKAIDMGLCDGADYAMTLHVMTATSLDTGKCILSYDEPCAPSADFFNVTVIGKGCHGSSPSVGIDPISCACRIITSLTHIKCYEIGIHDKAVMTVGQISGGNSQNVIPDRVCFGGTLRCFDEDVRAFYKKRFEEICRNIATAFRCDCEIEYTCSTPSLTNDKRLLEMTAENLSHLLGEENVIKMKDTKSKVQGSEDFAYIAEKIPSVSVAIAAGNSDDGYTYPLHNPLVIFDENALVVGCKVYAGSVIKILTSKENNNGENLGRNVQSGKGCI